uniref:Uncharacterized protein n=1 Tax=Haliea sp. ETY-M TaxID=1055105 RepID=A0A455R4W5_9GAMM|nr:hypothetical protein [Haliea sp. ETY-M]
MSSANKLAASKASIFTALKVANCCKYGSIGPLDCSADSKSFL